MNRLAALAAGVTVMVGALGTTGAARATSAADTPDAPIGAGTSSLAPDPLTPSSIDSYIVVLKDRPLISTIGRDQVGTPAADAPTAAIEASHDDVLATAGLPSSVKVQDYANGINGFAAKVTFDQARKLAADPGVAAVLPDELRPLNGGGDHGNGGGGGGGDGGGGNGNGGPSSGVRGDDALPGFLGLTARGEAWKSGFTGEGVTIGVIDTGIWPEHPSFADDGSYPAPEHPLSDAFGPTCQFGTSTVEPAKRLDAPFTCNNKLIGAREELRTYKRLVGLDDDEFDSARDDNGHGTQVASIAAGNAGIKSQIFGVDYGKVAGVAPRAQIVAYKAAGRLGAASSDLIAAIDQAIADHVDVLNYSIGGSANLLKGDALALLLADEAGIAVAASAGNGGPDGGTIEGPGAVPWVTSVAASTQPRVFRGTVTLDLPHFGWGRHRPSLSVVGASVTPGTNGSVGLVDGAAVGSEQCLAGKLDVTKVTGKVVLCLVGASSPTDKSSAVKLAGGVGVIVYNETDQQDLYADNAFLPLVMVDATPGRLLQTYVRLAGKPRVTLSTGGTWTLPNAPSMASFSARGPNTAAPDVIKPDLTAPGMQVLGGNSPVSDPSVSAPDQLFQASSGTSMASPIVAGMFAILRQAHRSWSPATLRSALMVTADTDVVSEDRRTPARPFSMGAGLVDPGVVAAAGSAFDPGLVYEAGYRDYLGFLCGAAPGFVLDPEDPSCAELAADGVPTTATDLNLPSIGVSALLGTTTVTRTVTSVASKRLKWRPTVKAPAGYRVTVSPSTLTIAPGASATFTVTIVATGEVVPGVWSNGSLTWTSGRYAARSPIAVQSLAADPPANVDGVGTDGSLTFSQQFGYTGPYSATAHGLVPPTALTGVVTQDPTPNNPADGKGGVVAFPVMLDGVLHARWTLPIAPGDPDDIDLYLIDAEGNTVAQSATAGSEQIDLDSPADGDYTLIVHGYHVVEPGGRPFTVDQWLVPAAPGDGANFTIAAPTRATVGTTADVTLTWHDLDVDTVYLGAVTHADAAGIFAVTLVDIAA